MTINKTGNDPSYGVTKNLQITVAAALECNVAQLCFPALLT